jgi:hypothetical protein
VHTFQLAQNPRNIGGANALSLRVAKKEQEQRSKETYALSLGLVQKGLTNVSIAPTSSEKNTTSSAVSIGAPTRSLIAAASVPTAANMFCGRWVV